jgi:hypothetical protein
MDVGSISTQASSYSAQQKPEASADSGEIMAKMQKLQTVNADENTLVAANMQTLTGDQTGQADRQAAGVNIRI